MLQNISTHFWTPTTQKLQNEQAFRHYSAPVSPHHSWQSLHSATSTFWHRDHYGQTWNRKYITYRSATGGGLSHSHRGCAHKTLCEDRFQRYAHGQTDRRTDRWVDHNTRTATGAKQKCRHFINETLLLGGDVNIAEWCPRTSLLYAYSTESIAQCLAEDQRFHTESMLAHTRINELNTESSICGVCSAAMSTSALST